MKVSFLFVTCCLEPTRFEILKQVVDNIKAEAPELLGTATVFDNASTIPGTQELLQENFKNVYVANKNVGYWTAIDWWLTHEAHDPPAFTYIIESDMIHYAFNKVWIAAKFLNDNVDIGAVRVHEYHVDKKHLYNKDAPVPGSRVGIWQSHTNKVTGKPVIIDPIDSVAGICPTNFLTQLCALNRYKTMRRVFDDLRNRPSFSEFDFQALYHNEYPKTAIIDGGIYHCDPGSYGAKTVTGSWSTPQELEKIGYQNTRYASIVKPGQYTVTRLV